MNIRTLEFKNKSDGWEIQKMSFQQLNLLVGASGVGKTQILQAIHTLKRIAKGESFSGIQWNIEFTTDDGGEYRWEGEFENNKSPLEYFLEVEHKESSSILYERLCEQNRRIIERTQDKIEFNNNEIVKLPFEQSIVSLLKVEDLIKPIHNSFKKILYIDEIVDYRFQAKLGILPNNHELFNKFTSLEALREDTNLTQVKLYIAFLHFKDIFLIIKDRYCEIFPIIEDIKVDVLGITSQKTPPSFRDYLYIHIKLHGSDNWIPSVSMSSGMIRTLLLLSEIYLCADNSVILIDEFENSLGINCIRDITNEILSTDRNIQFIITSHHPYIINNVEFQYWKLLTRNGGTIKAQDITEKLSEKSRYERFMQLIQLEEYQTGLEEVL